MLNEEVLKGLVEKEALILEISLGASAMRGAVTLREFIEISLAQGISREQIFTTLQDDLLRGGRIFGEFRSQIRASGNGVINRLRDAGQFSENGVEEKYRWAAVYVNTCPDCDDRHNMPPRTWQEWEAIGLPRTGHTICKQHCRCMLVPEEFSTIKPIKVDKRP